MTVERAGSKSLRVTATDSQNQVKVFLVMVSLLYNSHHFCGEWFDAFIAIYTCYTYLIVFAGQPWWNRTTPQIPEHESNASQTQRRNDRSLERRRNRHRDGGFAHFRDGTRDLRPRRRGRHPVRHGIPRRPGTPERREPGGHRLGRRRWWLQPNQRVEAPPRLGRPPRTT